jgi:hypothetical protein
MANLDELIERREQINEDIEKLSYAVTELKKLVHQCLEENNFKLANLQSGVLYRISLKLTIMLEQNVTLEEAEAIFEAQEEQAA